MIVVNRAFAQRGWPSGTPIGANAFITEADLSTTAATVVGVVGDVRDSTGDEPPQGQVYRPFQQRLLEVRDMAVMRASVAKFPIVLASATPSVESEVNARRGRYRRLSLPERFGGQDIPSIEAIDLRREGPPRGRFIAPRLVEAVKTTVERGEQALLFLNRRG